MINPFREINWKPSQQELRKFGWSLIIGIPLVCLFFYLVNAVRIGGAPAITTYAMVAGSGVVVGLLTLLVPALFRPLYLIWYALAACIGLVVSNLIMLLLYYGVITPVALVRRLLGSDPLLMKRKGDKTAVGSYWHEAKQQPEPDRYFSQY